MTTVRRTRVTDLQLAAFLLAGGYPLFGTEGPSHRVAFIFEGVPEERVFDFYRGNDVISARQLFGAYRDLKGLSVQRFCGQDSEHRAGAVSGDG